MSNSSTAHRRRGKYRNQRDAVLASVSFAEYWSVDAGGETFKDLAWSCKTPLPENVKIAGLVAFYNERADLIVDGEGATKDQVLLSRISDPGVCRRPSAVDQATSRPRR